MIKIIVFFISVYSLIILMFNYRENEKGYPVSTWWISLIVFIMSLIYIIYLGENGNHCHRCHHHIIKL